MRGEIILKERTNAEIDEWADFYLKKLVPRLKGNEFHHFRNEIEGLVDNGYKFTRISKKERYEL